MDTKPVSLLSQGDGVTPTVIMERFDKNVKHKAPITFPKAFKTYNKFMGGVDLHDQFCSDLRTNIGGKKWTWVVLCRLIESSLTNGLILYNMVNEKKISSKEFAKSVARSYLEQPTSALSSHLKIQVSQRRKVCATCTKKTIFYCFECKKNFCDICFREYHGLHVKKVMRSLRICTARNDCKQRTLHFCQECEKYICNSCFDDYHS